MFVRKLLYGSGVFVLVVLVGFGWLRVSLRPTKPEMEEDLQQLTDLYRDNWAYVAEKQKQTGHSLEDLHRMALDEIGTVRTWADFSRVVTHFVSRLEDGHSWIGSFWRFRSSRFSVPFRLRETREGFVVSELTGPAPGLQVGDLVLSLDGKPMAQLVEERLDEVFVSCASARKHQLVLNLYPSSFCRAARSHLLVAGLREGHPFSVDVPTTLITATTFPPEPDWITSEKLRPDAGLVRITTFYPDEKKREDLSARNAPDSEWVALNQLTKKELAKAMAVVQDCRTIIIDLRDNGGGSDAVGYDVADYFLPVGTRYYKCEWRNTPYLRAHHDEGDFRRFSLNFKGEWFPADFAAVDEKPDNPLYDKRVILITNEGCFSSTADFISAMQAEMHRLRVVGRPDDAGAGGPQPFGILKHSRIEVTGSTCRVYRPDGSLLEGHPVMPDVPVEWTQEDVLQKRDPDVAAALELASRNDW